MSILKKLFLILITSGSFIYSLDLASVVAEGKTLLSVSQELIAWPDPVTAQVQEVVSAAQSADRGKMPFVLIQGQNGSGRTTLARQIAQLCGFATLYIHINMLENMDVNEAKQQLHDLIRRINDFPQKHLLIIDGIEAEMIAFAQDLLINNAFMTILISDEEQCEIPVPHHTINLSVTDLQRRMYIQKLFEYFNLKAESEAVIDSIIQKCHDLAALKAYIGELAHDNEQVVTLEMVNPALKSEESLAVCAHIQKSVGLCEKLRMNDNLPNILLAGKDSEKLCDIAQELGRQAGFTHIKLFTFKAMRHLRYELAGHFLLKAFQEVAGEKTLIIIEQPEKFEQRFLTLLLTCAGRLRPDKMIIACSANPQKLDNRLMARFSFCQEIACKQEVVLPRLIQSLPSINFEKLVWPEPVQLQMREIVSKAQNPSTNMPLVVIQGECATGKTCLGVQLAHLSGMKAFYVNCGLLDRLSETESHTALDELAQFIKAQSEKIVLIFEEAHNLVTNVTGRYQEFMKYNDRCMLILIAHRALGISLGVDNYSIKLSLSEEQKRAYIKNQLNANSLTIEYESVIDAIAQRCNDFVSLRRFIQSLASQEKAVVTLDMVSCNLSLMRQRTAW